MHWSLLVIPFCSAVSCWLLIRIIVAALFHPRRPKMLIGMKIQGLIPASQANIANRAAVVASKELAKLDLQEKLTSPAQVEKIMPVIGEKIDEFLRVKIKKEMPVIGAFIGEKTIESLKKVFLTELESLFPTVVGKFAANVVSDLDIETLVRTRIREIPVSTLEELFRRRMGRPLALLQLFAAAFGLITGAITAAIFLLFP